MLNWLTDYKAKFTLLLEEVIWCLIMEQSATRHTVTVLSRTKNISVQTSHIPLFWFSFSLWSLWFLLLKGHVKILHVMYGNLPWDLGRQQTGCACARVRGWSRRSRSGPRSQRRLRAVRGDSEGHHHSSGPGWNTASPAFEMRTSCTQ